MVCRSLQGPLYTPLGKKLDILTFSQFSFFDVFSTSKGRTELMITVSDAKYRNEFDLDAFKCPAPPKLDRNMDTLVLDKNRVRESFEESLKTLNVDSVDILFLHDPEYAKDITDITKKDGAMDELFKIKNEGLAKAAGVAMGKVDIMFPLLKDWDFDVIINHNRYTLINREANEMYDYASSKNIAIFNAAPYAGGVLAKGPDNFKKITYQDATEEKLAPAREFEKVCKKHNVELGAAALQFSLRDNRITSTICGVTSVESIEKNLAWANAEISGEFWDEVLKLPFSSNDPESDRVFTPG